MTCRLPHRPGDVVGSSSGVAATSRSLSRRREKTSRNVLATSTTGTTTAAGIPARFRAAEKRTPR